MAISASETNILANRSYCYTESLSMSLLAVTTTVTSTHCAYPHRDGQAEWLG